MENKCAVCGLEIPAAQVYTCEGCNQKYHEMCFMRGGGCVEPSCKAQSTALVIKPETAILSNSYRVAKAKAEELFPSVTPQEKALAIKDADSSLWVSQDSWDLNAIMSLIGFIMLTTAFGAVLYSGAHIALPIYLLYMWCALPIISVVSMMLAQKAKSNREVERLEIEEAEQQTYKAQEKYVAEFFGVEEEDDESSS